MPFQTCFVRVADLWFSPADVAAAPGNHSLMCHFIIAHAYLHSTVNIDNMYTNVQIVNMQNKNRMCGHIRWWMHRL